MARPIFDIDDLSYFYHFSLGLRHAFLETGVREQREGCPEPGGDAVSLAHYLYANRRRMPQEAVLVCQEFQEKVEQFIWGVYRTYHSPSTHYNEAAWLLVNRGDEARQPYDFGHYPLGKCGKASFTAKQVHLLMSSEHYVNADLNHALLNTMRDFKEQLKRLKIKKVQELQATCTDKKHYAVLSTLIKHYENGSWIPDSIFTEVVGSNPDFLEIELLLNRLDTYTQKGDTLLSVELNAFNIEGLGLPELKAALLQSIRDQNLERVNTCLAKLPKHSFAINESNPITEAAGYQDTAILKAIFEHDRSIYELSLIHI